MSEYRRLISYIYEYEGKEKGKNVGFVKLEARNGQCRMNLSVKKVYVGGNAIGVYLLGKNGLKTFLGNIFVRGGNGEFRATVDAKNVEGTGNELDTYYGLTVHDVKNSWRSYTTIWEDAATVPEIMGAPLAQEVLPESEKKNPEDIMPGVAREIEEELEREEKKRELKQEPVSDEFCEWENQETQAAEVAVSESIPTAGPVPTADPAAGPVPTADPAAGPVPTTGPTTGPTIDPTTDPAAGPVTAQAKESTKASAPAAEPRQEPAPSPELENPDVLRYLQETEETVTDPEQLWQELRKAYPKIQPFDYDGKSEVLTIRPQDIGRLPRETWIYGNNSFLMHGYYNFRYLILVRLENPGGGVRYLLGVPGHYYSNEKYMATMFGFPNFVLSKKQPPNDGRFGYWYTEIKMRG